MASLLRDAPWTVIDDTLRLLERHVLIPAATSHCRSLVEPTCPPAFFVNMMLQLWVSV
jgi:hypothetical protein